VTNIRGNLHSVVDLPAFLGCRPVELLEAMNPSIRLPRKAIAPALKSAATRRTKAVSLGRVFLTGAPYAASCPWVSCE
jgi:chemotaxis signal transduction protein